jgi:glycosyltransferase involved in cell wall biosynthesis
VRVMFVTTGLESGGAEMMLTRLLSRIDRAAFDSSVVSLTNAGPVHGARIRDLGIPLDVLGFRRGLPDPRMATAVAGRIRRLKPDIVQTWMYHADLAGTVAAKLAGAPPVVWSVHGAIEDMTKLKAQTRLVIAVNRRVARWASPRLVYCSPTARDLHLALGYPDERAQIVSNGIDTDEFVPDPAAPAALRTELGLPTTTPLIGFAARFDPQKDHATFFKAAAALAAIRQDVHFVLCGPGVTPDNKGLRALIDDAGLGARTHLLGVRRDIAHVTAGLDISTSCSFSETFALTMAEAMSCGVPCVTTDLPAPAAVVGSLGWKFASRDGARLVQIWQEILELPANMRREWGERARARIVAEFSLDRMVAGYERIYRDIANGSSSIGK